MDLIKIVTTDDIDRIVDQFSDTVYRIAYARTKDRYHADDVYQEVFLRLMKKRPEFSSMEHLKAWLIRVAINCSKSIFLTSHYRKQAPLEDMSHLAAEDLHLEKSDLYYAVMDLPAKYRTVIYLHYYEGYKVKEIATILKQKETTVKSHLFRARKQIEEQLKGGYDNES